MSFTTPTFLLLFLISFSAYWSARSVGRRNWIVVVTSYIFYGWWDWRFCLLMLATSLLDFTCGILLSGDRTRGQRRLIMATSLLGNIGSLAFFKYFNFFVDSAVRLLTSLGVNAHGPALDVILPVGISFYTFQTLSYTIDVFQGRLQPTRNLGQYLAYVSFFPQLVAGPIERATHLMPQFGTLQKFDEQFATDGCRLILWGCVKKMLIADNLGSFVTGPYAIPQYYTGGALIAATVFFAFQIYCDFSGYTDIARGLGKLFGIDIRLNFALPYFSQRLDEFWRRWHITLSTWFRDYLYLPLGGNRVPRARHAFNVMAVFLLSGLWHGANWTFVMWGLVHGVAMLPFALARKHKDTRHGPNTPIDPGCLLPRFGTAWRILVTFFVVLVAWVFFRAPNLDTAMVIFHRILTWAQVPAQGFDQPLMGTVSVPLMSYFLGAFVLVEWIQRNRSHPLDIGFLPRWTRWTIYSVLFWLTAYYGTQIQSPFIYFQF